MDIRPGGITLLSGKFYRQALEEPPADSDLTVEQAQTLNTPQVDPRGTSNPDASLGDCIWCTVTLESSIAHMARALGSEGIQDTYRVMKNDFKVRKDIQSALTKGNVKRSGMIDLEEQKQYQAIRRENMPSNLLGSSDSS